MSVLGFGFRYDCEIIAPDGEIIQFTDYNLLPQVAIDHVAGLLRATVSPIGTWYVGIFENNYVPTSSVTAADLPGVVGECVTYSEATRPTWSHAYDGISAIDNLASKAVFTMTAAKRVYGAFLVSNSTKGGNTGTLLSIARFSTAKDLDIGSVFSVAAGITLVPAT